MRLDLSRPVILMAIAETLVWASFFYTFPVLLLRWETDMNWTRSDIALAFTLALVVSACASPFAGRLIDSGYSKFMFPAAAVLGGTALGFMSMVETQTGFFFLWAVVGLASAACLYEPCFAFLTRTKTTEARGAITTVTLVAGFASTICFPIADALTDAYGWRSTVLFFGVIAALGAAPLFVIACSALEQSQNGERSVLQKGIPQSAVRNVLRRPLFWLIAAAFPALALAHSMTISHLLPILESRGASASNAILAASLIGPCQVAGRFFITLVAAKRSATMIAMTAFFLVGTSMALLMAAKSEPVIFAAIILFGAGYGLLSIVRPLVAADFLGREGFGGIAGILALPYIAAAAAAPTVAALLWAFGGYDYVLALGLLLAILAFALIAVAARLRKIEPGVQPR